MFFAAASDNSVFPTLSKDECGWDASGIRGTLYDMPDIGAVLGVRLMLGGPR